MNRTTVITALACGLLLTAATPAVGASSDTADNSARSTDELAATDEDTLLINGRAFLLE
ncbi:hypothetical protein [Rathayibacter tritici]|uniref:hypothetical protein n=1 Tax=Rathayibacter tritici TaxID=33888 RepID=UPI0012FA156D|nr:hypothetical protein [Rathayibacter tritici]